MIKLIKSAGEDYRNGSELIKMMDHYNVNSLSALTDEQVLDYLCALIFNYIKKDLFQLNDE